MPDVDEKVVRLTLDNKDFDKDTARTIKSLDELKESLQFEGVGKGFDEITKSAKHVDLNPIEQGVMAVSNQFNLLTTIADTAFRNLTNKAIDAGERMIKSLSVDQITTGWAKYAEQTGAVQTIMAATAQQFEDTGVQMEEVNSQLEKLTWFTDETSHRFNDMVSGIGKFTANNIDLETSVKAMEGIATWASLSGANANEASRAIYNLAQAVSVGTVKLIDWRSIENANMGTTEFKQTVIETAQEVGTLVKVTDDLYRTIGGKEVSVANFSENLSEGWFTSDVLLKSLDRYGNFADQLNQFVDETGILTATAMEFVDDYTEGTLDMDHAMAVTRLSAESLTEWLDVLGSKENDLGRRAFRAAQETKTFQEAIDYVKEAVSSGWSTSFKYIFGDYLEAKEWWSEIAESMYDVFVVGGEIRNTILSMWKDNGGRDDFLDGIRALIENVKKILNIFGEAWNEAFFGDDEKEQLENRANLLTNLTKGFKEFAEALAPTENTARNIKDVLKVLFGILKTGLDVIKAIAKSLTPFGSVLNVLAGALLQIVSDIARLMKLGIEQIFTPSRIEALTNALNTLARILSGVMQIGLIAIFSIIEKLIESVSNLFKRIQENGGGISGLIITAKEAITAFWEAFTEGETTANVFVDSILFIFGGLVTGIKAIIETVIGLITGELTFEDLFNGNNSLSDGVSGFTKLLDRLDIPGLLENIVGWIHTFVENLTSADGALNTFINNIGDSLSYLGGVVKRLFDALTIDDIKDLLLIAILWNFVSSLKAINVSAKGVLGSISGTIGTFNNLIKELTGQSPFIDKLNTMFTKTTFLQIGIAITLLVAAFEKLNEMDWEKTQRSVAALAAVAAVLVGVLAAIKKFKEKSDSDKDSDVVEGMGNVLDSFGKNILRISAGMLLVTQAVKTLNEVLFDAEGKFDVKKALVSIAAITMIIGALVASVKVMDGVKTKGVSFVSVVAIAAGMMLIVNSIKALTVIEDWGRLLDATLAVAGIILALGQAVKTMGNVDWKSALASVPLLISFSASIAMISVAMAALAILPSNHLGAAIAAVVVEIVLLAGSLSLLGKALSTTKPAVIMSISAALLSMATAIGLLTISLKVMEGYDWKSSIGGLTALGVGFAAISGALLLLGKLLKDVKPDKITAIGVSLDLFAVSIIGLAAALRMLQGIQWADIDAGVITIGVLVAAFTALGVASASFPGLANVLDLVSEALLKFGASIALISLGISALATSFSIFGTLIITAQAFADKLGIDLPAIISTGFDTIELVIREFLEMLRNLLPDIVLTVTMLFTAISLAIFASRHATATAVLGVILAIADTIASHGQEILDAIVTLINFVNSATELFVAIESLAATIGFYFGSTVLIAVCSALAGAVSGLVKCIGHWIDVAMDEAFSESIEVASQDFASQLDQSMALQINAMRRGNTTKEAKEVGAETIQAMIQGWIDGENDLTDEMALTGMQALAEFKGSIKGDADQVMTDLLKQILLGKDDISDDLRDAFKELGDTAIEGWDEATDPEVSMDFGREKMYDFAEQIGLGAEDVDSIIEGIMYGLGGTAADGYNSGFIDNIKLFAGFGSRNVKYDKSSDENSLANQLDKDRQALEDKKKADEKEAYDYGGAIGDALANGLGSSLGSSKAGAAGAKTQAEKIKAAFEESFNQMSLDQTTDDLLYKLWGAQNPNATDAEKTAAEIAYNNRKLAYANGELKNYQQIYEQTVAEYGADSQEAVKAMHDFIQAQTDVLELQNKITELQDQTANSSTENAQAFMKFSQAIGESYESLKKAGFSDEQIRNALANEAGWKQPMLQTAQNLSEEGKAAAEASANSVIGTYTNVILNGSEYMISSLSEIGKSGNDAIANGLKSNAEAVVTAVDFTSERARLAFDTHKPEWLNVGKEIDNGTAQGIDENVDRPVDASEEMTQSVIDKSKETAGIHSPSTEFIYIGEMMMEGLKVGILSKASEIAKAAAEVVLKAIAAAKAAADIHSPSRETEYLGEMFDLGFIQGMDNYAHKVSSTAAKLVENAVEEVTDESNLSSIDKYVSEYLSGNGISIVLDVDTTDLDAKLSEYSKIQNQLSGVRQSLSETKNSGRYAWAFEGISAQTKDGEKVTAYTESQLQAQKEYFSTMQKATEGYSNELTKISGAIEAIKKQIEFAEFTKSLDSRYDTGGVVANFYQTNNSPEPLTRTDIYRDTKRQLEQFSKAMEKNQIKGRR